MNMNGVVITTKEIYDEVLKTSSQIQNLLLRVERIEKTLEAKEDGEIKFKRGLTLQLVASILFLITSAILIFLQIK